VAERPTAIFCANDQIALGALRAARERNIRVPEEISIAGFDDIPNAAESHPPLTTVRQPLYRMGQDAVHMLFSMVDGGNLEKRVLDVEIIERGTVGPPR
jgi:LacI family transcriptional regulator